MHSQPIETLMHCVQSLVLFNITLPDCKLQHRSHKLLVIFFLHFHLHYITSFFGLNVGKFHCTEGQCDHTMRLKLK